MFQNSQFKETENLLVLSFNVIGHLKSFLIELFSFVFLTLVVLFIPLKPILDYHSLLKLIYLAPLLKFPALYKSAKNLSFGRTFHFDRKKDQLTKNGKHLTSISEITRIELNYKIHNDNDERYLDIRTSYGGLIRIMSSGRKKNYIACGRKIAQFLKIDFIDNFPYGKEILWGKADVTTNEIDFINQHLKFDKIYKKNNPSE